MDIKFSLILCVYSKESPIYLKQCLDSVMSQNRVPDELVIIKDGPLTAGLDRVIDCVVYPKGLKIIALPKNITQGPARAEGVLAAKHGWIALMDSDDVCRKDRFQKQLAMIGANPELGLIGGQISEFIDDPKRAISIRAVPEKQEEIYAFAKRRNPFNSMTVMFRRSLAIEAGNFMFFPFFEDYDLWTRMLQNGAACANHKDILVDARVGGGMYGRRRGVSYMRAEYCMQKKMLGIGLINKFEFTRNLIIRAPIRMLPTKQLANAYNMAARDHDNAN